MLLYRGASSVPGRVERAQSVRELLEAAVFVARDAIGVKDLEL